MEQRTLGHVMGQNVNLNNQERLTGHDYTTFITLFGVNLSQRFSLDQIDNIDVSDIENVARLSALCSDIARDTWTQYVSQRGRSRERRVA